MRRWPWANSPESTRRWSADQWRRFLKERARIYFLEKDVSAKTTVFFPYLVNPVSDTPAADQIHRQITTYAYSERALPAIASAALQAFRSWRPDDGVAVGRFYTRLLWHFVMILPAPDVRRALRDCVGYLTPSIPASQLQEIIADIVNVAVKCLSSLELLSIASDLHRRSSVLNVDTWLARLRILQVLINLEGTKRIYGNIEKVVPDLNAIVSGDAIRKRFFADMIADGLGIGGVFEIYTNPPARDAEVEIYRLIMFSLIPFRIDVNDSFISDKITKNSVLLPPRGTHNPVEILQNYIMFEVIKS